MTNRAEKTAAEMISRLCMAVLGIGLLFGGAKCLRLSVKTSADYYRDHPYAHHNYNHPNAADQNSNLLLKAGWGLVAAGAFFTLGSVVPVSVLERFYTPPDL